MARQPVSSARRLRILGIVLLVGYLLTAAVPTFAAVDVGPGDSRQMFTLLAASLLVAALGGLAAAASSGTPDPRWTVAVVALMVVSGALLIAAAILEDGFGLVGFAPLMLLTDLWLFQALRAHHTSRPTTAAAVPGQPSG